MKILSSEQMYLADKATVKSQGVSSLELMERAASVCFDWIHKKLKGDPINILVFCGVGNNGGDGLVIARHLFQHGYNVSCYVVNFSENRTDEFLSNYNRLKELGEWPEMISSSEQFPEIKETDLVVDAIFGIGLKRAIIGFTSDLIYQINTSKAYTLSIDMPSGLFADKANKKDDAILEASHTLTFQQPKLAFFLPKNEPFIFTWEILDIALNESFIKSLPSDNEFVQQSNIQAIYRARDRFSHKGVFGHSLIIGGSYGKIGAVQLASKAALKSGSGLVTAYVPKCGYEIMQLAIPEVMVEVDADNELHFFNYKSSPTVIGVGPGIGTSEKTTLGFIKFIKENITPLIIDADAINILATNQYLLEQLPKNSILTPHPKEFERLVGQWNNDYEKIEKLLSFSSKYEVVVVLKGAHTVIANESKLYFNSTGNPGLATAGSGDVLTGLITGLFAQGYDMLNAAIMGVYLHGLSADIGVKELNVETFVASDILHYLSDSFKSINIE